MGNRAGPKPRLVLGEGQPLTRSILDEDETIQAGDLERQRAFVEKDLQHEPSIVRINEKSYILLGHKLGYWLNEHAEDESAGTGSGPWGIARAPPTCATATSR